MLLLYGRGDNGFLCLKIGDVAAMTGDLQLKGNTLVEMGKGDSAKAKEFAARAAGFNSLPQLNYAFVRTKAQKLGSG